MTAIKKKGVLNTPFFLRQHPFKTPDDKSAFISTIFQRKIFKAHLF